MRLTLHTDYALRLLMLLAVQPERLHTIEEAARRYNISRNHLMKVAQTLTQAGFIISLRGRKGGLRLARPDTEISLGAVVRATEDNFALAECFSLETNTCAIASVCGLRGPFEQAMRAFLGVLDSYNLADLIASPASFRGVVDLLPEPRTVRPVEDMHHFAVR